MVKHTFDIVRVADLVRGVPQFRIDVFRVARDGSKIKCIDDTRIYCDYGISERYAKATCKVRDSKAALLKRKYGAGIWQ